MPPPLKHTATKDEAAAYGQAIAEIRKSFGDHLYIGEQFGPFNAAVLAPFFTPLLRRTQDDRS